MNTNFFTNRFYKSNKPILPLNGGQKNALLQFREKLKGGYYSFEECLCLCGNNNGRLIAKRDRYGLAVGTYLCQTCGIMWTSPQMTKESLKKFYKEDYRLIYGGEVKASDKFFEEQVQRGKHIYDYVSACLNFQINVKPNVFDVGCGAGGILLPFMAAGCQTFGCDLESQYLAYGRERGLMLEHGEVNTLSKHEPAHLILLNHVLEHFKSPFQSIEDMGILLANGGYLYIELPGIFNIHNIYGDFLLFLQNAHLYHFTLDTLNCMMSKAGFKLIKGDQSIRAVYQKTSNGSYSTNNKEYLRILRYLIILELFRKLKLMCLYPKFCRLVFKI